MSDWADEIEARVRREQVSVSFLDGTEVAKQYAVYAGEVAKALREAREAERAACEAVARRVADANDPKQYESAEEESMAVAANIAASGIADAIAARKQDPKP